MQVLVSIDQVVLDPRGKSDSSHGFRVIQCLEFHVTSDYQPTQVLQRPRHAWGNTNKHIAASYLRHC